MSAPTGRSRRAAGRGARTRVRAALAVLLATAGLLTAGTAPSSAGQVGVTVGIQGAGSVQVVEGSLEDGASPWCHAVDNTDHRVTRTCARWRNSEPFEAWVWLRAHPAPGQWVFDGWDGCDDQRVVDGNRECAVHSGAFSSDERRPVARFRDPVPPTVSGLRVTQVLTAQGTFRFDFGTSDGASECRVEGVGEYAACASGTTHAVPAGEHRFQVRATDTSGNLGPVAQVDFVAVETRALLGPRPLTTSRTADFWLDTTAGDSFACSLDGAAYVLCGSSPRYTDLGDGTHVLRAYARRGAWVDATPITWTWTVDTTAPATRLLPTVVGSAASFEFEADAPVSFECRLTGPAHAADWAPCTSPTSYGGLAPGDHVFAVRGTDAAGNVEAVPASHAWRVAPTPTPTPTPTATPTPTPTPTPTATPTPTPTVTPTPAPSPTGSPAPADTVAPDTVLTGGPSGFVADRTASFGLAGEPGARFECTLDGVRRPCGTRLELTGLTAGSHLVTAAAVDGHGNVDLTPAVRAWTVPLAARELRITRGWMLRPVPHSYGGHRLETSRRGATLTHRVSGARKVALVVATGRAHGTVRVLAGRRALGTVRLTGRNAGRVVVPVGTFATPFTGRLRIVVRSSGRPVHLEGLGVATG